MRLSLLFLANSDLFNSDGLKLPYPESDYTIGVITKVDITDDGTDFADILVQIHTLHLTK